MVVTLVKILQYVLHVMPCISSIIKNVNLVKITVYHVVLIHHAFCVLGDTITWIQNSVLNALKIVILVISKIYADNVNVDS